MGDANFQKIQSLLSHSDLSSDEQNNFLVFLLGTPEAELLSLVELFEQDASWMRKIYDNYKQKEEIFHKKDNAAWMELLKKEEIMIQEMAKD